MPGAILVLPRWSVGQNRNQRRILRVNTDLLTAQRKRKNHVSRRSAQRREPHQGLLGEF